MAQLVAQNLKKQYRGRTVVDDISIAVGSGEIVGLLGPNGAGKTTCFYMIVGLIKMDDGAISIDDVVLTRAPTVGRSSQARKMTLICAESSSK